MRTLEFYLDFGGFYESIIDREIDFCIEDEIDYYQEEKNQDIEVQLSNYQELKQEISKAYIDALNETLFYETELKDEPTLNYISLNSPQYYNFETDTILTEICIKDLKALLRLVDRSKLIEYIDENSKSRDGFHSFYEGFEAVKKDLSVFCRYFFNYLFEAYEIAQSKVLMVTNLKEEIGNLTQDQMQIKGAE